MAHRTFLTTPPGETPELLSDPLAELYTPGLAMPVEPRVPMRFRGQLIALAVLLGLVAGAWLGFRLVTAGQDFDPSLDGSPSEAEFDPTIPGEG